MSWPWLHLTLIATAAGYGACASGPPAERAVAPRAAEPAPAETPGSAAETTAAPRLPPWTEMLRPAAAADGWDACLRPAHGLAYPEEEEEEGPIYLPELRPQGVIAALGARGESARTTPGRGTGADSEAQRAQGRAAACDGGDLVACLGVALAQSEDGDPPAALLERVRRVMARARSTCREESGDAVACWLSAQLAQSGCGEPVLRGEVRADFARGCRAGGLESCAWELVLAYQAAVERLCWNRRDPYACAAAEATAANGAPSGWGGPWGDEVKAWIAEATAPGPGTPSSRCDAGDWRGCIARLEDAEFEEPPPPQSDRAAWLERGRELLAVACRERADASCALAAAIDATAGPEARAAAVERLDALGTPGR